MLNQARSEITAATKSGESTVAPLLEEKDLDFLAQTKVEQLTQKDILKMYVGNWA